MTKISLALSDMEIGRRFREAVERRDTIEVPEKGLVIDVRSADADAEISDEEADALLPTREPKLTPEEAAAEGRRLDALWANRTPVRNRSFE